MDKKRISNIIELVLMVVLIVLLSPVPVRASETIRVQIVAQTPSGSLIPVPGALCQVTVGEQIREGWTDAQGMFTTSAVTGEVLISPIALPAGFKYLGEERPVLELESDESVSIPAEHENPYQNVVATSLRVPSFTIRVKDEQGKGVQGVELTLTTTRLSVNEKLVTDENGKAIMSIGFGLYDIAVTDYPDKELEAPDKMQVFLISDQIMDFVLTPIVPESTESVSTTTTTTTTTESQPEETTMSETITPPMDNKKPSNVLAVLSLTDTTADSNLTNHARLI